MSCETQETLERIVAERIERSMRDAETLADIAHYMRQEVPPRPGATITKTRMREILHMFADRIEAAWKREKTVAQNDTVSGNGAADWKSICAKCVDGEIEPECEYYGEPNGCNSPTYQQHPQTTVGNAAAMREALKDILKDVDCAKVNKQCDIDYFLSSIEKCAKAALSAPPRNCDRFSNFEDALSAWRDTPPKEGEFFDDWIFAAAEKGAEDEQK